MWTVSGLAPFTDKPAPIFKTKKEAENFKASLSFVRVRVTVIKIEKEQ